MRPLLFVVVAMVVALLVSLASAGHRISIVPSIASLQRRSSNVRRFRREAEFDTYADNNVIRVDEDGTQRFAYAVRHGSVDFDRQEEHDVEGHVNGGYSVLLPDGRRQVVSYKTRPDGGLFVDVTHIYSKELDRKRDGEVSFDDDNIEQSEDDTEVSDDEHSDSTDSEYTSDEFSSSDEDSSDEENGDNESDDEVKDTTKLRSKKAELSDISSSKVVINAATDENLAPIAEDVNNGIEARDNKLAPGGEINRIPTSVERKSYSITPQNNYGISFLSNNVGIKSSQANLSHHRQHNNYAVTATRVLEEVPEQTHDFNTNHGVIEKKMYITKDREHSPTQPPLFEWRHLVPSTPKYQSVQCYNGLC